jgi:hypothetical protein
MIGLCLFCMIYQLYFKVMCKYRAFDRGLQRRCAIESKAGGHSNDLCSSICYLKSATY